MQRIKCMLMRGGTSKGAYFLAEDLPSDPSARDDLLQRIMGSPDARQIDGIGGAHPLTSKVAVISEAEDGKGVDYLFLQVSVDEAVVSSQQNCGNLLAGVGPFAIERGLVDAQDGTTEVHINLKNTGGSATASVPTTGGEVVYDGDQQIAGVPGSAAPIVLNFEGTAGSTCGSLLPTGQAVDVVDGVEVTCIDNGMPTVVLKAKDLGLTGHESVEELEADETLKQRLEKIRLKCGPAMGLGDVAQATVPKMCIVSESPTATFTTRTFIPRRCHTSIGVLCAASVAAAWALPGSAVAPLAALRPGGPRFSVEHPTGVLDVEVIVDPSTLEVTRTGVVRTARKLFDGFVFPRTRI